MTGRHILAAAGMVFLAGLAACSDNSGPAPEVFTATLSGAAEVPAKTSNGTGSASFTVNDDRTITYDLAVSGITATAQHIHGPADATVPAGVIVGLTIGTNQTITPTSLTGAVNYDSLLVLLRNGHSYVNVHTAANPGGEIRGQILRK
ncbi:MAG TPA: CHRD domain-containing protein [Longimicrobiales bacterium]